ncbi:MAG: hypothetical protein QE164_00570 [Candidatus Nezhaarchaeota archaeon]|nr:hypothetical protein [Candidatus Nezhaarchaeota archaeon]
MVWPGLNVEHHKHCVYNTSCDEVVTLKELANYVKELVPNAQIEVEPGDETPRVLVSANRMRDELQYKHKVYCKRWVINYVNYLRSRLMT